MIGNGYGDGWTTRDKLMREHDALPASLRVISSYAVARWSAGAIEGYYLNAFRRRRNHERALAQTLKAIAAEEALDTLETYGPNHPEARP